MSRRFLPTYFSDISFSLTKLFIFSCLGLLVVGLFMQMSIVVTLAIKSPNLYFDLLKLCLYLIPYSLSVIIPFAFFIATLWLLYRYRRENYLLSLQNLGLTPRKIYKPFYTIAVLVSIAHYFTYIALAPAFYAKFKTLQFELKQKHLGSLIEVGTIKSYFPEVTIYVDKTKGINTFEGIFISDNRSKDVKRVFSAKEGSINLTGSEITLLLHNGSYCNIDNKNNSILSFDSYSLSFKSDDSATIPRKIDTHEMTVSEMLSFTKGLDEVFFNKVKTTMHQKIVWPLYSMFLAVLCLKLEWLFYYKSYRRGSTSRGIMIIIVAALFLSFMNFLIQKISLKFLQFGTVLAYLNATFLLQMICLMVKFTRKTKKID